MHHITLLTPDETASMLKVTVRTLEGWRRNRKGPKCRRLGHRTLRYALPDVEAWMDQQAKAGAN